MKKKINVPLCKSCNRARKCTLSLLSVLFLALTLQAQIQYNQWAFGWHASHDFITGNPLPAAPLITSQQDAASWCDPSGNLMFYTDGKSIYNPVLGTNCMNCLNGNPNGTGGTQGALILPRIGGPADEFYIFTVSDKGMFAGNINKGLSYYIYNTTTGALSSVTSMGTTPGTKGSFTSEGLTAIPHNNGVDYWIIVKPIVTAAPWIGSALPANQPAGANNNSIYAYRVTSAGVSPDPVVSDANYSIILTPGVNQGANDVNEIKCSPDRQHVTITNRTTATSGVTMLYRFNASSGKFAFLQQLPMLAGYAPFGSSFSPNSKVLYVCGHYNNTWPGPPGGAEVLRQYDLTNIHCAPFTTPQFCDFVSPLPFNAPAFRSTQLQLTPDGRIFRVRNNSQNIDVISTPNNIGCANIGYIPNIVPVGNAPGELCKQGLPNNIDAQAGPVLTSEWPKTTVNTVTADNGVSVDVDQYGDVYSAGVFRQSTQFETVTITGTGSQNTYLAKYDDCDGLEWVARAVATTATGFVSCHSMDVGNLINRVLITGRFRGTATFYSGVTPGGPVLCPAPISVSGGGIFIATYNYNGCLLGVTTIPDDANYIHSSAHINVGRVYNPVTGFNENRVYLAINETALTTDNFIRIFAFVQTGPAILNPAWIVPLHGSPSSQVNDIHSDGARIAVTGTYDRDIFWNTSTIPFASTPTGVYEAFVCVMNDVNGFAIPNNYAPFTRGFEPASGGSSHSSGSAVQCVGNTVLLTGTYTGTTTNVFATGLAMAGNGTLSCSYAIRLHPAPVFRWAHSMSCDGITFGHDVTRSGNFVYFTGTWTGDSLLNINTTVMPTVVPMKNHMYVIRMHLNGNYTSPACWQNHSYMADDATQIMKPSRIAIHPVNPTWVYVNGSYIGTGQMANDIAYNSPLTSTAGTTNSFVWRYRVANGISFREGEADDDNDDPAIESEPVSLQLHLFPNPAQSALTVQLNSAQENTLMEIYNVAGQLLISRTTSLATEQVDVSEWAPGIYFVRITNANGVVTEKFMKE